MTTSKGVGGDKVLKSGERRRLCTCLTSSGKITARDGLKLTVPFCVDRRSQQNTCDDDLFCWIGYWMGGGLCTGLEELSTQAVKDGTSINWRFEPQNVK